MIATVIRNKFINPFRPFRLSDMIEPFDGIEFSFRFYSLVEEYLPEEKAAMLKLSPVDADKRFVRAFSKKYFQLRERMQYESFGESPLRRYTQGIPVEWHGLRPSDYDDAYRIKNGQLVAGAICENPRDETEICHAGMTYRPIGSRVALVDRLSKKCEEAALMATKNGHPLEKVEQALKDSPYPGLLTWCRWIYNRTGNVWLDRYEDRLGWSRENVELLTRDWKDFHRLQAEMNDFERWVTGDFKARSVEVIDYVNRKLHVYKKVTTQGTLMEVFTGDGEKENQ